MTDKLFQALDRMPQTARMRRGHAALLGDGQGNLYVFNPDGSRSSGMVWARVDGMGVCSVRCRKISQQRDLPVIVDYGIDQVLEVVEENGAEAIAFTGDRGRSVGPHRDTHDILGPDPDFIQGLRLLPLLCHPTNPPSLSVYVRPYSYEYNGMRKTWIGGGIDLTSEIPTSSNEQLLILVCLNPATNALSYYTGSNTTPFVPGDSVSFTASEIDAINTGTDWQIAAIRAYAGQTQFMWSDWMADRRGWISGQVPDLSGYVQKSLFDANSLLIADSDNTPFALTTGAASVGDVLAKQPDGTIDWDTPSAGSAVAVNEDGASVVATADTLDFKDFNVEDAGNNDAAIYQNRSSVFEARLTLETGVPISTTDQTSKTVVYLTPYRGNKISLYDGTRQKLHTISEISIKITDAQTGTTHNGTKVIDGLTDTSQLVPGMLITGTGVGAASVIDTIDSATQVTGTVNSTASASVTVTFKCPANTVYDLSCFSNSGTPKLEMTQWTNITTRATALALQDGVEAKNGATTRRYVGTFCTTIVDGQCEMVFSSPSSILLWNRYNQVEHQVLVIETANSWVYNASTFTFRPWNNTAANRFKCIVGINEEPVKLEFCGLHSIVTGGTGQIGIGLDSTSIQSAMIAPGSNSTNTILTIAIAKYDGKPGIGYHYFQCLECSNYDVNVTFYGDIGYPATFQSGMSGTFRA
jgi:hypothetical protein